MNGSKHLTDNQLADYFGNLLERETKHVVGRHLLQCDLCLKKLPQPTPEQFMAALMAENETNDASDVSKTSLATQLKFTAQLLKRQKIFALSAGGLAIVLFFSAFVWLGAVRSSVFESEVAENFEIKDTPSVFNQSDDEKINLLSVPPTAESDDSSLPSTLR